MMVILGLGVSDASEMPRPGASCSKRCMAVILSKFHQSPGTAAHEVMMLTYNSSRSAETGSALIR